MQAQIHLSFSTLKTLKTGYENSNFYVIAKYTSGELFVSFTKNILFDDVPFHLTLKGIENIQVWNYDTRKKIGQLSFDGRLKTSHFSHIFKNHNLNLVLSCPSSPESIFDGCEQKEELDNSLSTDSKSSNEEFKI